MKAFKPSPQADLHALRERADRLALALVNWRLDLGYTPDGAARLIGITPETYRRMEDSRFDPAVCPPALAVLLMRATGLGADALGLAAPADPSLDPGGAVSSPAPTPAPGACDGADATRPVALSDPAPGAAPCAGWRARGWRVRIALVGDEGWTVGVELARDRLTPEQAVELAAELFKEAALARAG